MLLRIVERWVKNRMEAKWFLRMLFLELNISLHPLQNSFLPRRQKFSPGNSSIRLRELMFLIWIRVTSFLLLSKITFRNTFSRDWSSRYGTGSQVLKGLNMLEVDVPKDDAIFDLKPEGSSHQAISMVACGESQSLRYAQGNLESAGPYYLVSIFSKTIQN